MTTTRSYFDGYSDSLFDFDISTIQKSNVDDRVECLWSLYKDIDKAIPISDDEFKTLITNTNPVIKTTDNGVQWTCSRWTTTISHPGCKQNHYYCGLFPQVSLLLHRGDITPVFPRNAMSFRKTNLIISLSDSKDTMSVRQHVISVPRTVYSTTSVHIPVHDVSVLRNIYRNKRDREKVELIAEPKKDQSVKKIKFVDEETTKTTFDEESKIDTNQDRCLVCLEDIVETMPDQYVTMPCCKTKLCIDCSHDYLVANKVCMICRELVRGYDKMVTAPSSCAPTPRTLQPSLSSSTITPKKKQFYQYESQGDGMLTIQFEPTEMYACPNSKMVCCESCNFKTEQVPRAPSHCPFQVLGCDSVSQQPCMFAIICQHCNFEGILGAGSPLYCENCDAGDTVQLTICLSCERDVIFESESNDCPKCKTPNSLFSEQCQFCGSVHGIIGRESCPGVWFIRARFENEEVDHNFSIKLPSCSHGTNTLLLLIVAFSRRRLFSRQHYHSDSFPDPQYIDHLPWEVFSSHWEDTCSADQSGLPDWNFVSTLRHDLQKLLNKQYPSYDQDVQSWRERLCLSEFTH